MFLQLSHTKLPIYAVSQKLVFECYQLTKQFPSDENLQWYNKYEGQHYLLI